MKNQVILLATLIALFAWSCIEEKNNEIEQPSVELLSPAPCDTLYFGKNFLFAAKLTDIVGLGNISMDLHHNFGHHTHGNHETCSMDAKRCGRS